MKNTKRIVELIKVQKDNIESKIEYDKQNKVSHQRDKICLAVLVVLWIFIIFYTNYGAGEPKEFKKQSSASSDAEF